MSRMMRLRMPPETALAVTNERQRERLTARAKLIPRPTPSYRIVVVVGGRGSCRRLSDLLAPKIGSAVVAAELGHPVEAVDAVREAAAGCFPRVVILAPLGISRPIVDDVRRRSARWGLGWPDPVDLLMGLRSVDRESFLRLALRTAGAT